jgi:serine protease Do
MPTNGEALDMRPALDRDLTAVAAELRRITVEVQRTGSGAGSGLIWASDGLIVTNAHVAAGRARVVLPGGRALDGRLLAWDPERDLAALAIDANGLATAEIRDSDTARVGELVVAVGAPLGLAGTVTVGVIHAIAPSRSARRGFIQADLRLAPGNSGGPMADARGRVIGINAMVAGGLAVAVPSNAVARFIASLPHRAAAAP